MSRLASLDDLFVQGLRDIYHAEGQKLTALPLMVRAATHSDLKYAFEAHLRQTEDQIRRLTQAFRLLGLTATGEPSEGMGGLLAEGRRTMAQEAEASVMDAALIASAQKVEHYEIASYACVCTYAELLGYDQAYEVLARCLEEEETIDQQLTALASRILNPPTVDSEQSGLKRGA